MRLCLKWTQRVRRQLLQLRLLLLKPPLQLRLAYRMLGSRTEAEDIVQEAWLRWQGGDHGEILDPAAWLTRVVARAGPLARLPGLLPPLTPMEPSSCRRSSGGAR
mgnify:CR=1 FL=1